MNKKRSAKCTPHFHAIDNTNKILIVKGSTQGKSKNLEKKSIEGSSVLSACSVLSPTGVGVLTTGDQMGAEEPFFDIDLNDRAYIDEERRAIQEFDGIDVDITPRGREKKQGGDRGALPPEREASVPEGNINLNIDTKSPFFEKDIDYDTLMNDLLDRGYILSLELSDIFHRYGEFIKSFHKKIGVMEDDFSWVRYKNKNTGEKKTFLVKESKNRRYNIYDAIDYWKRLIKKFNRFNRVKGDVYLLYVFSVPPEIAENWTHKTMIRVRRKLVRMLRGFGLYQKVVAFHFWSSKNPTKRNLHFHILVRTNRRIIPHDIIKRKWAKILKYNGVPDVFLEYKYDKNKAFHYYKYMTRPYIYELFLWWLQGGYIDWDEVKWNFIEKWQAPRMRNIEFYGYLKKKDEEEESEWEKLYNVYLAGYKREKDKIYAIFWYYDEDYFDIAEWGLRQKKKYYKELVYIIEKAREDSYEVVYNRWKKYLKEKGGKNENTSF